jgi:hypothetical protein
MQIFFPKLSDILKFIFHLKGTYAARIKTVFLQHSSIIERVGCARFFYRTHRVPCKYISCLDTGNKFIFPYVAPT